MTSRIVSLLCCAIFFFSVSPVSSSQEKGEEIIAGTFSSGLTPGGTPVGWRLQKISGRTRFSTSTEGKASILRVDSKDSASGLFRQVEIDPKQFQKMSWRWRVERAIASADEREKDKDDCAARLFVIYKDGLPKASRYSR